MNLFDNLVQTALSANKELSSMRPVVEKEIMHHDILREMNKAGFLRNLTFMGGTCLRLCYGGVRLSEDLDFTGGFDFHKRDLTELGKILKESFKKKYDFALEVSEPEKEDVDVHTWKIKISARQEKRNMPLQRINLDISLLPSYERRAAVLKNYYGIDSGSQGIILFAESLNEIFADKIIAFALRLNRIKNRDLWDIAWLNEKNITLDEKLLKLKLKDRKITLKYFFIEYERRVSRIKTSQNDFLKEMARFLAPQVLDGNIKTELWWDYLLNLLTDIKKSIAESL